jgi:hypothetical protein
MLFMYLRTNVKTAPQDNTLRTHTNLRTKAAKPPIVAHPLRGNGRG